MRSSIGLLLVAPLAACATTMTANQGSNLAAPGAAARADTIVNRLPRRDEPVRIVFPATATQPQRTLTGNFRRLTGNTVIVARGIQADTVRLGDGQQLQVVTRSRGHGGKGALIGTIAGAVVGGVAAAAAYTPCTSEPLACGLFYPSQGAQVLGGAVLGAGAGALVGWLVGSGTHTEEWGTVNLQAVGVSVRPAGLGVRISF
jgi:hypothetical protein